MSDVPNANYIKNRKIICFMAVMFFLKFGQIKCSHWWGLRCAWHGEWWCVLHAAMHNMREMIYCLIMFNRPDFDSMFKSVHSCAHGNG